MDATIVFHCSYRLNGETTDQVYDATITLGECLRNVCVNLGIDPDTHDGVTRNIRVYYKGSLLSQSDPYQELWMIFSENEEHWLDIETI